MFRILTITIILAIAASLPAQSFFQREKRDYIWLLGYASSAQVPGFGGTRIDFNSTPPTVAYEYRDMNFEAAATSICDAQGNLLFYTNGIYVANYLHEPIENGMQLDAGPFSSDWAEDGVRYPQTLLSIPNPGDTNEYFLFHLPIDTISDTTNLYGYRVLSLKLYYSRINMSGNNGASIVLEKNQVLVQDTLDNGKLTAVRHANGRDWWIVVPENDSNGFYRLLVTPDTILNYGLQTIGDTIPSGLGQAAFSPDGAKYARLNLYRLGQDQYVDIYDFDRCTGTFSSPVQFTYRDTAIAGGLAFSENSRFLYITSTRFTYQFDLDAGDISASKIVVGSMLDFPDAITCFFLAQLAPNGKIIIGPCGTRDSLHVIHNPNKKGISSNFEFNGIKLPTRNFRTIPNFPYYGLGPMDGSPCDTLGIDNPAPTAAFEYTADSAALAIEFFDGSFFATGWYWDFGDGATSTQRHPVHSYAQSGAYIVCLTASNLTGSDTVCDTIQLGEITSLEELLAREGILRVYPNPTRNSIQVEIANAKPGMIRLLDMHGRVLLTYPVGSAHDGQTITLDAGSLNNGIYLLELSGMSINRQVVRIVIMK
ncbi:MAG: T9SS type A sorting domain-containing protein [Saprospiraceae bacterium]|nr:T9SS type A sorting domain-containing protein [Saprospiraceae bacterium]